MLDLLDMVCTVDLHDKALLAAHEVDVVASERNLATKLVALEPSMAEGLSEAKLGVGGTGAEFSSTFGEVLIHGG